MVLRYAPLMVFVEGEGFEPPVFKGDACDVALAMKPRSLLSSTQPTFLMLSLLALFTFWKTSEPRGGLAK